MNTVLISLSDLFLLFIVLISLTPFVGAYFAKVFRGKKTFLHPVLRWLERLCYRLSGVLPQIEMTWKEYALAVLALNGIGFIVLFLILITQQYLPFNPEHFPNLSLSLAFNTAASLVTTTGWPSFAGETTLSYLSQTSGIGVQLFLAPATGIAIAIAFIRGLTRRTIGTIGNFWVDITRTIVYILIPLACVLAIILVSQGVIQTLSPYERVETIEGKEQIIPLGPVASYVAINRIGGAGNTFFNAGSAHPFLNPTPVSNFFQNLFILLVPAGLIYAFGILTRSMRHAQLIFAVISFIFLFSFLIALTSEQIPDPSYRQFPVLEGLETRLRISKSLLWSISTSASANGSQNTSITSLPPLAGGAVILNVLLGGQSFGGVGVGLCRMLLFIFLTLFLSGLIVGRTPEYLGKKLRKEELQWTMFGILTPIFLIVMGMCFILYVLKPIPSLEYTTPHDLSAIALILSSASFNNGCSFSGFDTNTPSYNIFLSAMMLIGRTSIILASLAASSRMGRKSISLPSARSISTQSIFFTFLLFGAILLFGALIFFPVLVLGPFSEHLFMLKGKVF